MKVVAGAILVHNGKIFIAKRPEGKSLAHHWEFPGGKQEEGETLQQCLKRELREELNIEATIGDFFMTSEYKYEFGVIQLNTFFASISEDCDIHSNEHENVAWVTPEELKNYTFAPADIPIVAELEKIKLA